MTSPARHRRQDGAFVPLSASDTAVRFWSQVNRPNGDGCWEWTGRLDDRGYGRTSLGGRSRNVTCHRFAWALTHGAIPDGLCVLHRCDNPKCVRPAHLFLGTLADNNRDREAKGRSAPNLSLGPKANAARTACVHGHAYDEVNTGRRPNGRRWCRACARIRDAARRAS